MKKKLVAKQRNIAKGIFSPSYTETCRVKGQNVSIVRLET